ncbi:hypothetical protein QMP26_30135 [Enterocloster clostridioformis]
MSKKSIKAFFAMALCLALTGTSVCYAAEPQVVSANSETVFNVSDYMTKDAKDFMDKLMVVYEDFELDENGSLVLANSVDEIKEKAGFSDEEMVIFQNMMTYSKENPVGGKIGVEIPSTRLHVEDWKVYFTFEDVGMYLSAAAAIGPAAITAALSAMATTLGPVGTAIGAIVGYVVSADLCYLVLQAGALGKGIYIGLDWNGPFPSYTQGLW